MAAHRLCAVSELPEGVARVFEAGGHRIAVARSGRTVFALEDRCSHDDGELGEGEVRGLSPEGGEIECPRHGARFEISTGRATRMPAVAPVETFPARIDGDVVVVDLPES